MRATTMNSSHGGARDAAGSRQGQWALGKGKTLCTFQSGCWVLRALLFGLTVGAPLSVLTKNRKKQV